MGLARRPCGALGSEGAGGEVGVGGGVIDGSDNAARADLAAQGLPMERKGGARIGGQLARLGGAKVGEEIETGLVPRFKQDHADIGLSVGVGGGEGGGGGVVGFLLARAVHPRGKESDRVVVGDERIGFSRHGNAQDRRRR